MSHLLPPSSNGVTRQFVPEDFRTVAHSELLNCPPWEEGVCFLPECSQRFDPSRPWQIYCCPACERRATNEMRKWGHRLAMAALVWRMGKYNRDDQGVMDLTRAARRHFTHVQSAWLADRNGRLLIAQQGEGGHGL